jgi:Phospholipase_D-nuclease N-terminal
MRPEEGLMPVPTNPFMEMLWGVLLACLWVAWLALLFVVMADIFRRRDLSGRVRAAWIVVATLLPFLGVLAYMASQHDGMTERKIARAAAKEVENAEFLRDIGAITQVEFDAVKQKASNLGWHDGDCLLRPARNRREVVPCVVGSHTPDRRSSSRSFSSSVTAR